MILRRSFMWNLEPSGKVMNLDVESRNGILLVMNYGLRVDWMEQHHIILRKVMVIYLCRYCEVALEYLFCRVNVIGL